MWKQKCIGHSKITDRGKLDKALHGKSDTTGKHLRQTARA